MKTTQRLLVVAAFMLFLASQVYAQVGTLAGQVKDEEGNPLPEVLIKIQGTDVKRNYQVKTDKNGKFYHGGVALQGLYRVIAEKEGFATDYVEGIRPAFGQPDENRGTVNFTLRKGKSGPLAFELTPEQREQLKKQAEEAKKQQEMSAEVNKNFNVGLELARQGQYAEAVEAFKRALEKAPTQPYIWANLGSSYVRLKQYEQAIEAFHKAIEQKADDPALYQNLGNVYAEMGDVTKAKEIFEKAAGLSAGTNPKDAAINYYNIGVTFINSGKNKEAAEALQKAVEADPSHAEAHYQLGIVLLGLNNIPQSLVHLKKYVELTPGGPNAEVAQALIDQLGK